MLGNFNIPSVDHLREGVDYRIMEWDFADNAPVPHTPGEPCPPGHKMVFGMCRKVGGSGEWDPGQKSEAEKTGEGAAKTTGSTFENNRPVMVGGKKYGWAKKGGKPVLVEWGSVCAKKVNGVCVPASAQAPAAAQAPAPAQTPPTSAKPAATPLGGGSSPPLDENP